MSQSDSGEPPSDDLSRLTAAAEELVLNVNSLNKDAGRQLVTLTQRAKTNRQLIWALAASFLLDILLTIALGLGYVAVNDNSNRIGDVTGRLDQSQTVGRQRALCPLYQLFLDSKSDAARQRNPDGPEAYDKAFKTIEDGYNALMCDEFKKKDGKPPVLGGQR